MPKTKPLKATLDRRNPIRSTGLGTCTPPSGRNRVTSPSPMIPIGTLIQNTQCQLR